MSIKKEIEVEGYFRFKTACSFSGFSMSHLKSLIKEKEIESFVPTPKIRLIRKIDLIKYIEKSKVEINE
jgi:hypothetical protein